MEIAGLLTGILPDTVEVLKCFKLVSEKLHVFRHWSREVGRIHDKVWTQRCIFEHEWKHLLTGVVGSDEEATLMLSDPGHIWWADQSLDTCIKECLGSDAELLSKLVQNLVRQLGELQRGLNAFEPVGSLQRRVGRTHVQKVNATDPIPLGRTSEGGFDPTAIGYSNNL